MRWSDLICYHSCVAGGIVSAREIKSWRRSRQASGEAVKRMGRGTLLFLAALPPKLYFACAIPPATQASDNRWKLALLSRITINYDLLVTSSTFFVTLLCKTSIFHAAVCLFSDNFLK